MARALAAFAIAATLAGAGAGAGLGCERGGAVEGGAPPAVSPEDAHILSALRRFESEQRAAADFGEAPASDHLFGADPYVIRAIGADRYVGILRGADALVLLDEELTEIDRAATEASPSGLAVMGDRAFVVGEGANLIVRYRVGRDRIDGDGFIGLDDAHALRDVAVGPNGVIYAVEEEKGRLFTLMPNGDRMRPYDVMTSAIGAGAFRVARTKSAVVVACLLAHTIVVHRVDAQGRPEPVPAVISNDGPLWSFSAIEESGAILIASGGVENKPLDRTHGSFENIDSFVYLDRVTWEGAEPSPRVTRLAEVNVSEHGVVVPKALSLRRYEGGLDITATGYGGDAFVSIWLRGAVGGAAGAPEIVAYGLPAGTSSLVEREGGGMVIANPLLDAWILYRTEHIAGGIEHVPSAGDALRSPASRLGEALIFTTVMAPWNRSDGPLSRFTCETCHFEGYVDGRTHSTGRGAVRATTKPLLGLFNNRPHFSRALDPDLSSVAHNEFRVAGARSDHDPVFTLTLRDAPWLGELDLGEVDWTNGVLHTDLGPIALRRAFMQFLMDWSHRRSAITVGRTTFDAVERRGAEVFRDRCEGCHHARLASDVDESRALFAEWEGRIFSEAAPIVWGQAKYEKTGVEPYVSTEGARIPSLRRLYKKHPYFTNGTAKSLGEVLARVRLGDRGAFFHDGAPSGGAPSGGPVLRALSDEERAALEAFLRLL